MLAVGALLFSCDAGGRCRETENSGSGFILNPISTWKLTASSFWQGENWNSANSQPRHSAINIIICKTFNIQRLPSGYFR